MTKRTFRCKKAGSMRITGNASAALGGVTTRHARLPIGSAANAARSLSKQRWQTFAALAAPIPPKHKA